LTTAAQWWQGARPRTLSASVAPVVVGTAVAARYGTVVPWRVAAAAVVAVALQVGVNYANDYSDGVRGVDTARRTGPVRLTAAGLARPVAVKRAALLAFAVAGVAGVALAVAVDLRLLLVGAAAVLAAALYSGGPRPYASAGLGEVSVLVFFGFVATCGSAYVHLERVPWPAVPASVAVGLPACAILLANNLRDVETDRAAGKRTLAVRVGAARTRALYTASVVGAFVAVGAVAVATPPALLALAAAPLAVAPVRAVATRSDPPSLVRALVATARLQLVLSVLLAAGLAW
jgi:1,4-dihydroxy-2-naphthoate octaprenyltransferase